MTKTALLVVDVQKGFINEHTAHIPALIQELIPSYQTIFATRFYNPEGSNYRRLLKWHRFSRESQDTELAFTPNENVMIIDKPIYTCVTDTFLAMLDELAITEIHIVGIETDICVSKCAVDLFERKRTPFVLANYCASYTGPDLHKSALQIIAKYIGDSQIIS